jgi:hypothetical protein
MRRRVLRKSVALFSVTSAAAAGPAAASAPPPAPWPRTCDAQPDVAVLDEYCQTLPSAGTGQGGGGPAASREPPLAYALPRSDARRLARSAAGRVLLSLPAPAPAGTGILPPATHRQVGGVRAHRLAGAARPAPAPGRPLVAVSHALGDTTLGGGFRWAVVVVTGGLFWAALLRRWRPAGVTENPSSDKRRPDDALPDTRL